MIRSTLCYIEHEGSYLMLYRNRKENDANAGKWVGVGGKFLENETPEECVRREVKEETGFEPLRFNFLGIIEFRNDSCENEDMYLFTAELGGEGDIALPDCNEGTLKWIPRDEVLTLNLWAGDRYFLEPLIEGAGSIGMRLEYSGDRLLRCVKY